MSSDSDSDMPAVHDDAQFEMTQAKAIPGGGQAVGAAGEHRNDVKVEYGYVELPQFGQSIEEPIPIVQENAKKKEVRMDAGEFARREGTVADVWQCTDSISRSFVNVSHHDLEKAEVHSIHSAAESGNWGAGAMQKSSENGEAPEKMEEVEPAVENGAADDDHDLQENAECPKSEDRQSNMDEDDADRKDEEIPVEDIKLEIPTNLKDEEQDLNEAAEAASPYYGGY